MKFACTECIQEEHLQVFIQGWGTNQKCSFCGERGSVAPIAEIMIHVVECLQKEYSHAINFLSYESREGGYLGTTYSIEEMITEVEPIETVVREVLDFFAAQDEELWAEIWDNDPIIEHHWFEWEAFCTTVKHTSRYTLLRGTPRIKMEADDDSGMDCGEFLQKLLDNLNTLGVIHTLKKGTILHRARVVPELTNPDKDTLGPPPKESAKASRMSPAGIPVFYSSLEESTCVAEIQPTGTDDFVLKGQFKLSRDVVILDLASRSLKKDFSIYGPNADLRIFLWFLRSFRENISRPIQKDGREHIEYVPTQVVAEYVKFHGHFEGAPIDAIAYPSSLIEGTNLAFFVGRANDEPFEFIGGDVTGVSEATAKHLSGTPRPVSP